MGRELRSAQIREFLSTVGNQTVTSTSFILVGGSGLCLLGNDRPTLDLDYAGEEKDASELRVLLERVAWEMHVEIEAVPLHRFIPIPAGADERHVPIGSFGNLQVFVFDPYSIALSKLDRGFDSDIEDVVFLLRRGFVELTQLGSLLSGLTGDVARQYDLDLPQMNVHLNLVRSALETD